MRYTAHIEIKPTEKEEGYIGMYELCDSEGEVCKVGVASGKTVNEVKEAVKSEVDAFSFDVDFENLYDGVYAAWTDGSANNLSPYGEGGAAYILFKGSEEIKRMSKGFLHKTNNWCEMIAIISAIASVPPFSILHIHTDSKFAIKYFTSEYITERISIMAKMFCQYGKDKHIIFHWVKGHNGDKYNEECDKMAGAEMLAIRQKHNIPTYSRYNSPKVKKGNTDPCP